RSSDLDPPHLLAHDQGISGLGLHGIERGEIGRKVAPLAVGAKRVVGQKRHDGLHILAPCLAEADHAALRAAAMKARMSASSFTPGALSTPEETSTCRAPVRRIAVATFSGVSPPARIQGQGQYFRATSRQSKASPLPPGSAAPFGGLASMRSWSATFP